MRPEYGPHPMAPCIACKRRYHPIFEDGDTLYYQCNKSRYMAGFQGRHSFHDFFVHSLGLHKSGELSRLDEADADLIESSGGELCAEAASRYA